METLKSFLDTTAGTAVTSASGIAISYWDAIPEILRILILLITLLHLSFRAFKEIKDWI